MCFPSVRAAYNMHKALNPKDLNNPYEEAYHMLYTPGYTVARGGTRTLVSSSMDCSATNSSTTIHTCGTSMSCATMRSSSTTKTETSEQASECSQNSPTSSLVMCSSPSHTGSSSPSSPSHASASGPVGSMASSHTGPMSASTPSSQPKSTTNKLYSYIFGDIAEDWENVTTGTLDPIPNISEKSPTSMPGSSLPPP